ncbi:restriction endonuclease subunit S [Vibrio vulnificus]|uniref:restriction endonuclease subunit S n=1 Tax=Vibrio vulnificus TaxID=672 RepID=UPI000CD21494|nr:restriction endonuclease subunit S [Vibrio vulnificus]EHU9472539.1 hypothetical protein [Vibrio vulnificus]POC49049.1 restriction endonuclease subunit S [Vibrio vulnificus]RZQ87838.1 restriction endonuclease subunit S [Vibrio vulnificus]
MTALSESNKYQAYPEYKDSGVEWLDKVPSHWNMFSGKRVFCCVRRKALSSDEQLAASQKFGVVPQSLMMELNDAKVMLALKGTDSFRHVEKDNFVISLRSFEGGIEHSAYVGCVSPAYTVLEAIKNVSARYYKYLLKSKPYIAALQASTDSLRDGKSISFEQFSNIWLPLFEVGEQAQIANFLDHETAKIDTLIEKQQQLIKLLKEKRQAVISHAVSAKDGERAAKLSYFTDLLSGYAFPSSGFKQEPSDAISLLRGINVGVDHIKWNETVYWPASDAPKLKEFVLEEGDIVFGMDRPWISSGARVAEIKNSDLPCFLLQRVARIRSLEGTYQPFVKLCLASNEFKRFVEADLTGVSVPHISPEQIKSFPIRAIGYEKQKYVTDLALANCKKLDEIEKKAEKAINLMQERRTALISAAVTGKIDVRNWQAPTHQDQALEQTA